MVTSKLETKLLITVLYSRNTNLWKLADFGLTAEATSKLARTTEGRGGTPGYRAPELLKERSTYTNKVDLWALGCIIHELATGKIVFPSDWAVRDYCVGSSVLDISLPSLPEFWQHHLSENIRALLERDGKDRPRASETCQIFASYYEIVESMIATTLAGTWCYPSYQEWKELVNLRPSHGDLLLQLATLMAKKSEKHVAGKSIRRHLEPRFFGISKEASKSAVVSFHEVMQREPMNFVIWDWFGQIHIVTDQIDIAIRECEWAMKKIPANLAPLLELSNLHATKGNFTIAITTTMKLLGVNERAERKQNLPRCLTKSNYSFASKSVYSTAFELSWER